MTSAADADLADAARALAAGRPVVLPTDTVYGLAALPSVPGATAALFALKERGRDQPLAVLVADVDQALALAGDVPPVAVDLMHAHWPGPLTLVLHRSEQARTFDLGGDPATIGVRCPDHELVRRLAERLGPLATTSANRSGRPTPATAAGAAAALVGPVDVVVDGGTLTGTASTVVDVTGPQPRVLREGPLSARALGLGPLS